MLEVDLESVLQIEGEADNRWTFKDFQSALGSPYVSHVATLDSDVLGFSILLEMDGEAELLKIGVDLGSRRQGIGRKLMQDTVTYCRNNNINTCYLEVRESNLAARQLYLKHGFFVTAKRPGYYPSGDGSREDALLMKREFKAGRNSAA